MDVDNFNFSNGERVEELQKCHVCTEIIDHAGNTIDDGPGNCFNLVGDEYLEECDPKYDSCASVMFADWYPDGSQEFRFTRKCYQLRQTASDGDTYCFEGSSSVQQFKDCYGICTENGCNNNTDVVNANSKLDENDNPIEIR